MVVSSQWLVSSRITAAFIKLPVVVFFSSSVLVSPPYPDLMVFSISAGYVSLNSEKHSSSPGACISTFWINFIHESCWWHEFELQTEE